MQRILVIVPVAASILLLAGCRSKEQEKEAEPVLPVEVAPVTREPIQRLITAEGVLRAVDQSAIVPKITAPVAQFFVNRGDHVRKGQLLARLENRDLAAAVVDAKGTYEQAQATYRNTASATVPDEMVKAQADVDAARQSMDSAKKVLDSREQLFREGALARRLVDESATAYAQAKSQFETAQRHLESMRSVGRTEEVKSAAGGAESARGKYQAAEAQLAYSEVRSPISGVIADRAVFPGEMPQAGSSILTVMDVSSVIARINVPQAEAQYLRVGQPAHLSASDSSVEANGKVTVVSPAVDPQATTVEVWVQAPNPGEKLRPGGTVHVTIQADTIQNALVVPATALLPSSGGGTAVMVIGSDSKAHEHPVQVGARRPDEGKVQIASGVNEGDRVVVQGGVGLADGAKVELEKPGQKGKEDEDDKKGGKDKDDEGEKSGK